jgi:hypothetical protein
MNNNMSYDVPDFRREEDRRKYEHDYASPYPDENFRTGVPCSSQPYEPTAEDIAYAESIWKDCCFRCD